MVARIPTRECCEFLWRALIAWGVRSLLILVTACSFHPPAAVGDGGGDDTTTDAASPLDAAPADWWDPTYRWRIPIAIANTSNITLATRFQIGLRLDLDAAPCAGSRDAIRITHDKSEHPRYIDELGGDEWTWFRLEVAIDPGVTSNVHYLYCANPSPGAAPADPAAVFDFFDDFDGAALTSDWKAQNTVIVGGGAVRLGGAGLTDSGILTTTTWPPRTAVDYIVSIANPAAAEFWAGFQNGFPDQPPWIQWWSESPPAIRPDYASSVGDQSQFLGTPVALDTMPRLFGVEYYGTASAYRRDNALVEHHVHATPVAPAMLNFRLHNHSSTEPVQYHMARVRRAVDPPPTVTLGAPETY